MKKLLYITSLLFLSNVVAIEMQLADPLSVGTKTPDVITKEPTTKDPLKDIFEVKKTEIPPCLFTCWLPKALYREGTGCIGNKENNDYDVACFAAGVLCCPCGALLSAACVVPETVILCVNSRNMKLK